MLAVTRKQGDRIHINDDIVIHILEIKSKNVRVGIQAPPNYLIFRGEIYDKIIETNKEMIAASFDENDIKSFLKNKGTK
jgi:carbon storage regulator